MRRAWHPDRRARAPATVRQLRHAAPAVALLWVPVVIAVWAELPGASDLERGVPMLRAMLLAGLAPLLVAVGMERLRAGSLRVRAGCSGRRGGSPNGRSGTCS